jgi:hypothetical protein
MRREYDFSKSSREVPLELRVLDDRGPEFNQAQFPELAADIRDLALRRAV